MKRRSRLLAMLCAILLLVGAVPVYAATAYGVYGEIETSYIYGSYTYGTGGNNVMVKMEFKEKHSQTGQVYSSSCSNIVMGIYTKASQRRNADTGYKYTIMDVYGYVNGVKKAESLDCIPKN